jgi:glycosyltransferase involved in cell wall biosynthesis
MFSGGDTNLKMFEYMAVGLPIITTEFGARGLEFDKTDFYLINKEPIKIDFNKIKNIDTQKNRKYVEVNFDWEKIAEKYNLILKGYKIK